MPGPSQHESLALGLTELLFERHRVGQALTGVAAGGLEVDHRPVGVAREVADDVVTPGHRPLVTAGKRPYRDGVRIAGEHPGRLDDVLHRGAVHDGARLGLETPAALA